jgi:hypothetical protein
VLEQIKDFVEFIAEDAAQIGATVAPFALAGLLGLYVLWLVVGYLRVSQVGLDAHAQPAVPLPPASDGLMYPLGATFCAACERDLLLDCVNDGATVAASEAFCYRCGTPTGAAETSNAG